MLAALLIGAGPTWEIPQIYGSFESWADWAAELLDVTREVPEPVETEWERWAAALVEAPSLQAYNLPGPAGFDTWEAWATEVRLSFPGPV